MNGEWSAVRPWASLCVCAFLSLSPSQIYISLLESRSTALATRISPRCDAKNQEFNNKTEGLGGAAEVKIKKRRSLSLSLSLFLSLSPPFGGFPTLRYSASEPTNPRALPPSSPGVHDQAPAHISFALL